VRILRLDGNFNVRRLSQVTAMKEMVEGGDRFDQGQYDISGRQTAREGTAVKASVQTLEAE
jgi:hypothetical protein